MYKIKHILFFFYIMKLYIHIANINQLKPIWDNLFNLKDYEKIKNKLKIIEYKNKQVSFQYKTYFQSISILKNKKYFGDKIHSNVYWFYFWNDTCEHLIPTLREYIDFEKYIKELNTWEKSARKKTIAFVTSSVWDYWIKRLKQIFNYLYQKKYKTEIIVNDLWVLHLINKEYSEKLIPVLWRMLNKAQRNPIIDKNPDPQVPNFLGKDVYEKIKKLQYAYYDNNPLSLKNYKNSFIKHWIKRFWVDNITIEGNQKIKENLDIYYPYNSIAHWRNCATRWIQEKTWEYYVQDIPCARYCQKYDVFLWQWTHERWITQRGNGIWKKYMELDKINKEILDKDENRLIFSPFIPV